MAIQETFSGRSDGGERQGPPRWLLLLLAAATAVAVGEAAGILAAVGGTSTVNSVWTGCIGFGSTLLSMLTVIGFLTGAR